MCLCLNEEVQSVRQTVTEREDLNDGCCFEKSCSHALPPFHIVYDAGDDGVAVTMMPIMTSDK